MHAAAGWLEAGARAARAIVVMAGTAMSFHIHSILLPVLMFPYFRTSKKQVIDYRRFILVRRKKACRLRLKVHDLWAEKSVRLISFNDE